MAFTFTSFAEWKNEAFDNNIALHEVVLNYEIALKSTDKATIYQKMLANYQVMCEAIQTGLIDDMTSFSRMINNGGKKVNDCKIDVLGLDFKILVATTIAAKEVNSCMGRIVAAPTAGASGIIPGVLYNLELKHNLDKQTIADALLLTAGIALIIHQKASLSGAVGGCQAETGSASAMAAGAIVYSLGGSIDQVFNAVAIAIQCTLGLVCDPVAGLVEVPCVVRNASAASIAFTAAQIAIADVSAVIPVDECIEAMGEIGLAMENRYKETAQGGLAATKTGKEIKERVFGYKKK